MEPRSYSPKTFKKDLLSGLIVFLIALPLCLGIAQASGAPLFSGIVAGIVGGIVVGFLSGSHISVSGPAAGLIAIVAVALPELNSFGLLLCAIIIAGIFQLILGYLKAGSIANYIPSSVLEGMLAGIGLIIVIKQLPDAVGFAKNNAAVMVDAEDGLVVKTINLAMHHIQEGALIISIAGLAIMFLWKKITPSKRNFFPSGLLVVLAATLINQLYISFAPGLALDGTHLIHLPVAATPGEFFGQFAFPDVAGFASLKVWETGLLIACVASIESLLCIEASDKLDPHKRYTPIDRELKAQGIGNIVSGLLGGLPVSSVIMRTSANIYAGARTKRSAIFHGILLLICAAAIPAVLNLIPKAAIAAILIYIGYKLARRRSFKHIWDGGRAQFIPFAVTALGVVAFGLLKGVGIGLAISIFYTLRQNIKIPYYYKRSTYDDGELIKLTLAQEVSFLNRASIKETLEKLPDNSTVIIDASNTEFIDFDVLEIIRDYCANGAKEKGINMSLTGFKEIYRLPAAVPEREILARFLNKEEVPQRSSGTDKNLLAHLRNNFYTPKNQ